MDPITNGITLGHPEAHEKLTARLLWKRTSETGYNDAGNVKDYVNLTTRSLVTRATARDGARFVNDEQSDLCHEAYTFLLDERVAEQEVLLNIGRQLDNVSQPAAEGSTATLSSVVGNKWFAIGSYNIANVTVTASASGSCEEGTDYELDKENGRLRVIPQAGISDGENLTVTFDRPGIEFEQYESQYDALFYCDLIVEEYNQHSKMWLRRMAFAGYLNVIEFPTQTGEFGHYRVKATPSGPVTTLKRPEGQTLPTHEEGGGAANSSSSSSNSSASSSNSSSST